MQSKTAIYIHKPTQKVIWRHSTTSPYLVKSKFYWEKEKLKVFEWLIRERWLDRKEVEIRDYRGTTSNE